MNVQIGYFLHFQGLKSLSKIGESFLLNEAGTVGAEICLGGSINIHSAIVRYSVILHIYSSNTSQYILTQTQWNMSDKLTWKEWNYYKQNYFAPNFMSA